MQVEAAASGSFLGLYLLVALWWSPEEASALWSSSAGVLILFYGILNTLNNLPGRELNGGDLVVCRFL